MISTVSFEAKDEPGVEGESSKLAIMESANYRAFQRKYPNVTHEQHFASLAEQMEGKLVALFLDYDGTLTPIVNNPDEAFLSEETRDAVRELATLFPAAIISGRGRAKVEEFVQLEELYYAGSHGMDIAAPKSDAAARAAGEEFSFQPAARYEALIQEVRMRLTEVTSHIEGSSIEDNKYCVSVHFRNCRPDSYDEVVNAVDNIVAQQADLHVTRGRKVLEVRPKVDWDKGSALVHLVDMLGISSVGSPFVIYIGDDRTDEDAFAVLKERSLGAGILVSSKVKETKSMYTVQDPGEVRQLLQRLVEYGRSDLNEWRRRLSCTGWRIGGV